jgi:hypothetical protein
MKGKKKVNEEERKNDTDNGKLKYSEKALS